MEYIPVKVNSKTFKQLKRDASGLVFFREDEDGNKWVKAACRRGRLEIEKYHGLIAHDK